jgi:hypothetical protein
MKKLFFNLASVFCLILTGITVSAQQGNYGQIGAVHNAALNELYTQPDKGSISDAEAFRRIEAYVSSVTGDNTPVSYEEVQNTLNSLQGNEFSEVVNGLVQSRQISTEQANVMRRFETFMQPFVENATSDGLEAAVGSFKATNITENRALNDIQKESMYALVGVTTASFEYHLGVEKILGNCCWKCVKSHFWKVIWKDGVGAAYAIIKAVATGKPIVWKQVIIAAGKSSYNYLKSTCPCCF